MKAGIYRHYKGGYYQCLGVGEHTETKERVVVYIALDATREGPRMRVRPLDGKEGWNKPVIQEAPPGWRPRFEYVGDEVIVEDS